MGGAYFLSLMPFNGPKGKPDLIKHPIWFQRGIRGAGCGLIALAMYRLGEVAQALYIRSEKVGK